MLMELSWFRIITSTDRESPADLLHIEHGFEYRADVNGNPIANFIIWQSDLDLMVQLEEIVVGLDQIPLLVIGFVWCWFSFFILCSSRNRGWEN